MCNATPDALSRPATLCKMLRSKPLVAVAGAPTATADEEKAVVLAQVDLHVVAEGVSLEWLHSLIEEDILFAILESIETLGFEAQKQVVRLFALILRRADGAHSAKYLRDRPEVCQRLVQGCGQPQAALHYAEMLGSMAQHQELVAVLLDSGVALELIALMENSVFEIAADAMGCLRKLLHSYPEVSASYMVSHFSEFFVAYHHLLSGENYIIQRQVLQLLVDLLETDGFCEVAQVYLSDERCLRVHMLLLRSSCKKIQDGALHVLKLFVLRPVKPKRIHEILRKNSERLLRIFEASSSRREDDEEVVSESAQVISTLRTLQFHKETSVASVVSICEEAAVQPSAPAKQAMDAYLRLLQAWASGPVVLLVLPLMLAMPTSPVACVYAVGKLLGQSLQARQWRKQRRLVAALARDPVRVLKLITAVLLMAAGARPGLGVSTARVRSMTW